MRQEERKANTVSEIEKICVRLFARQGIENTTLDEIAREANLTKGAIYWHYSSKIVREFYRQSASFIESILEYGESQGSFPSLPNRSLYAFHILSALAGAHAQWFSDPELDLAALLQEVEIDTFLRLTGSVPALDNQ